MKSILVTGSRGQLGRAINEVMDYNNDYMIINTGKKEIIDKKLGQILKLDICNKDEVDRIVDIYHPDIVINCAAHTAVDLCETDVESAYKINVGGTENLAKASKNIGAKFFQISSDYVFDGKSRVPYTEDIEPNPQSVYAKTKYESEKLVVNICDKYFVLRTAWMYGEGKNFVQTMLKLIDNQDVIKVVNDQYGTPTSAKAVAKLIKYLIDSEKYGLYHATCEGSTSWYEFANEIFKYTNKNANVIPINSSDYPLMAKRPSYSVLENKNLKENTNFTFFNWKTELAEYLKAF